MKFCIPVRVTRARKCRDGFYVVINGKRLRKATRALAIAEVEGFLALQKIQVCTVREFADRNRKKISARMPKPEPPPQLSATGGTAAAIPASVEQELAALRGFTSALRKSGLA